MWWDLIESNSAQTHERSVTIGMERTITGPFGRFLRLCLDACDMSTLKVISWLGNALSHSGSAEAQGL
jgi:hypothetical protein